MLSQESAAALDADDIAAELAALDGEAEATTAAEDAEADDDTAEAA